MTVAAIEHAVPRRCYHGSLFPAKEKCYVCCYRVPSCSLVETL
jgi:hypothetical protein